MPVFSPASSTVSLTEFIGTAGTTVTVSPDAVVPPAVAETITVTNVTFAGAKVPSDLVLTHGTSSFTFSSTFSDYFTRHLKYLVYDEETNTKAFFDASTFSGVSVNQTGMYQYTPPSVTYVVVPFTVTVVGSTSGTHDYTWNLTVNYDATASNAAFSALVLQGTAYTRALTLYPELSS